MRLATHALRAALHTASGLLLLLALVGTSVQAQTTLAPGDLVVIGSIADNPDAFSLLAMVDIETGTEFKITDKGVGADGTIQPERESIRTFTTTAPIAAGEVLVASADADPFYPAALGIPTGGTSFISLSESGDQLLIYQGETESPQFVFLFSSSPFDQSYDPTNGGNPNDVDQNSTALPPGLTNGTSAIDFDPHVDDIDYDRANGTTGTQAELLALVANDANYITSNDRFDLQGGSFTVTMGGGGITLPITFEEAIDYEIVDFEGTTTTLVTDPEDGTNMAAQTVRGAGAATFAGTVVANASGLTSPVPFTADATTMSMRVWSPRAGVPVRLKVERVGGGPTSETETLTTMAGMWETLVFDFADPAPGQPPVDPAETYDKLVVFFDFGRADSPMAETFYWDDIEFGGETGGGGDMVDLPITFEDDMVDYELTDFGGAASMIVVDPTDATNMVVQTNHPAPECFAGTTVANDSGFISPIPFEPGATTMSVRVWSPAAGLRVRFKVEKFNDTTISVESDEFTTVAGAWETLVFDFTDQVPGTAPINFESSYTKASIFFNFTCGIEPAPPTNPGPYYWDDIEFGGEAGGEPAAAGDLFSTRPSGANEVPPNDSDATGLVLAQVGEDGTTVTVTGSFSGLGSAYAASHLHLGPAGMNGGVLFTLNPTVDADGRGGTFEADNNTFTFSEDQLVALADDGLYVNIHSADFPGGEIRGQLSATGALIVTGVIDGPLTGGTPKAVELYALVDIADLSTYAVGSANNGGGTDGPEIALSGSASAGDFYYITDANANFNAFFGFDANLDASTTTNAFAVSVNGDDAVELFFDADGFPADLSTYTGMPSVVDTFGDIDTDGTGEAWEYLDGWAYRADETGPDGDQFVIDNWFFSGVDALDDETTNAAAAVPFPIGTYSDGSTTGGDDTPVVSFVTPEITWAEGGGFATVKVRIDYADGETPDGMPVSVSIDLTGGTADASDVTSPTPMVVTFTGTMDGEIQEATLTAVGNDGDEPDEVALFGLTVTAGAATVGDPSVFTFIIRDTDPFEFYTIADARALGVGEYVSIRAVVTRTEGAFTYIQDDTGALTIRQTSGAFFDGVADGSIHPGTYVRVTGELSEFRSLLQINGDDLNSFAAGGDQPIPEAQVVTLAELAANGEAYEAELVTVQEVTLGAGDNNGGTFDPATTYAISDASDASGAVSLRVPNADDTTVDGTDVPPRANVTAVVGQFSSDDPAVGYQLLVIEADDIEALPAVASETGPDGSVVSLTVANPIRGTATVRFSAGTATTASVALYDMLGRRVATLAEGSVSGAQTVSLDASSLSAGVYVLRLQSEDVSLTETVTVVR